MTDNKRKEYRNSKGQLHREDGPAVIGLCGTEEWWYHGKRHREYGPAVVRTLESREVHEEWWYHGNRHREFGPAVIFFNGDEEWWQDGMLHRLDGPALISSPSNQNVEYKEYWIKNVLYSEKEWERVRKRYNILPDDLFEL